MGFIDQPAVGLTSYDQRIHEIRSIQLPNWQDSLYLDAAASAPVPTCVLNAVHSRLTDTTRPISNPHSQSPSGRRTHQEIDDVRTLLCKEIFNVQRKAGTIHQGKGNDAGWELIFNSGTTAGLQLVARSFNFGKVGKFGYLQESHSSLYGLRDVVQDERKNGAFAVNVLEERNLEEWVGNCYASGEDEDFSLLAMPLQCNATGKRYHHLLARILEIRRAMEEKIGKRKVFILLDAASYLSPSSRMNVRQDSIHQPDFICFSMIKLLGYPSGVGGLLIQRSSSFALSAKSYFGGGSLDATTSQIQWRQPKKELYEYLEDGTLNLFGIIAIPAALHALRSNEMLGSWKDANDHVDQLSKYLWNQLNVLQHSDGSAMCELYSAEPKEWKQDNSNFFPTLSHGSCVLFNILRASGSSLKASKEDLRIDPAEVDRLACMDDIHLRSGRMCNVGAITKSLDLDEKDIIALWNQGIGCGNSRQTREGANLRLEDPAEYERLGALVHGALRVSLSAWNTFSDIDRFVAFLEKYFYSFSEEGEDEFVECHEEIGETDDMAESVSSSCESHGTFLQRQTSSCGTSVDDHDNKPYLEKVFIYPIKSCAAQQIFSEWKLTDSGLEHDRNFCVVDLISGNVMSQKRFPSMARIRSRICLEEKELEIKFYDEDGQNVQETLKISLLPEEDNGHTDKGGRQYDLCGTSLEPQVISDVKIQEAFSQFLGVHCTLARSPLAHRSMDGVPLKLSNESPFLLTTSESIDQICRWMEEDDSSGKTVESEKVGMTFRANFIISQNRSNREECSPFYEDQITQLRIGNHPFTVIGPCRRCEMIALDPVTGAKNVEVMKAVARHRRCQTNGPMRGKLLFGQHLVLRHVSETKQDSFIKPGMVLKLDTKSD